MAVDVGKLADKGHAAGVAEKIAGDDPGDLAEVVDAKAEVGHDAGKDGDDYDLVVGGDEDAETGGEDGDVGAAGANHGPAVKSRRLGRAWRFRRGYRSQK